MIDFKLDDGIIELELRIGIKEDFFLKLLEEDDWSFIIKLHSLFEAACNHLLLYHLKEPNLTDIINRIDLSSKPIGKLVFLEKLELISKEDKRLISKLSELRNNLVHDIKNYEFNLKNMIEEFGPNQLRQFAIDFSPFETLVRYFQTLKDFHPLPNPNIDEILKNQTNIDNLIKRASEDPKFHIWFGSHSALKSIVDNFAYSSYQNWMKAKKIYNEDED